MAAATVMRLQGIVSREVAGTETAVVTVGALRAGSRENIISDEAELLVSIRSFERPVHDQVVAAVERIVRAEALASGAPAEPDITVLESFPAVVNDPGACARTSECFEADLGQGLVLDPGLVTGSEDVGILASAAGAPLVYWLLGGGDPGAFAGAAGTDEVARIVRDRPSNHSPQFAPVIEPTLGTGIAALMSAARCWLPAPG